MLGVIKIFLSTSGLTKWTVLFCLLLASIAEAFGLASLLPVLKVVIEGEASRDSTINRIVIDGLALLGLPANLETLLTVVVIGMITKSMLLILAMRHVGFAVADVATNMRRDLIRNVMNVKWGYFTRQPIGRLANAVSLDTTRSGAAYLMATMFVASSLQTIIYVGLSLFVSWKLALFGLGLGGLIVFVLKPLVRKARKAGKRQRKRTEELVTMLSDTLSGIKPLKAMDRHHHFAEFFERKTNSIRKTLRRQVVSKHMMKSLQEPLLAIFLAVGFYMTQTKYTIGVPELVLMGLLLQKTVKAIGQVQRELQNAVIVESTYWSVHKLITEAHEHREVVTGGRTPTLNQGCALDNVSFAFGDKQVLDHVHVTAPAKQLTVVTGASGVGKTTMTDLLLGLYEPNGGTVLVDGVPLSEIDVRAWRGMVGYVPQELTLFHDTVLANVTLGDPAFSRDDAIRALKTAGAWEFVEELPDGVDTTVGERGSQLSGGQRQRIALARALVSDPELLILDEVTSALDPETEEEICENIRGLAGGRTIIAITHRPVWVDVADRVYHMGPDGASLVEAA